MAQGNGSPAKEAVETVTLTLDALPAVYTIVAGGPEQVDINDNDTAGVSVFPAPGIYSGTPGGTWGSGSSNPEDPFNTTNPDGRAQFVILASELADAGFVNGTQLNMIVLKGAETPGRREELEAIDCLSHIVQSLSGAK